MKISIFLNFLLLQIVTNKSKHLAIFIISTLIIFIMASVMFLSSSIQKHIYTTLDAQSDFVIQKINSGKIVNTPNSWIDDFSEISAVKNVQQRVFGQYYYESENIYFTIVGVDLFEESTNKNIKKLLELLDISDFLDKDSMIIGNGVKQIFDKYRYKNSFDFVLNNRELKKISIYKDLPISSNLVANDLIIMDISLAKEILNIPQNESTDIVLNVPNELERDTVKNDLIFKHLDIRVIKKSDIKKLYENIFNYKGGIFLILYIIVIITFILILYQRYSMITSVDKKEIGILRAVGWSIADVIKLKISETFLIAFISFLLGVILAYIFVFLFNAPILNNIFLGFQNLNNTIVLDPHINISNLFMLFLFFVIPYISAILIPVWKISTIEPSESMK
ncbi:MAG: ABC transporter permease [Poseidonibacter sp.]|uniref:ABC transporter permease n=1 Tax=Poseidonibacter sp. TaxID=2321188 RepID=UPI00359E7F1F